MKHQPRKRFGQNFLCDPHIINAIISAIHPQKNQTLIEIGPGLGALTEELLRTVNPLHVVEIDRDLVSHLQENYGDKLIIHTGDVLQFDFATLNKNALRIVGNLPYNISTPLLFYLLNYAALVNDMFFMLQKEVVERICASVDDKNYGRLSVMLQYYCQVDHLFNVPNTAFNPPPKVESAIIRLAPYQQKPQQAQDEALFATVVKTAFTHRRKTINNNLKPLLKNFSLADVNIATNLRPEALSVRDYVTIANALSQT
jgi:16S rRNA (adenine1518-N6/adenine1519-N6)-dimethyltransferase